MILFGLFPVGGEWLSIYGHLHYETYEYLHEPGQVIYLVWFVGSIITVFVGFILLVKK